MGPGNILGVVRRHLSNAISASIKMDIMAPNKASDPSSPPVAGSPGRSTLGPAANCDNLQLQFNTALSSLSAEFPKPSSLRSRIRSQLTLVNMLALGLLVSYGVAFVLSLRGRWFNPLWSTDDATQQTYPLYDALYPNIFKDDLVSEVMRGCLPPLHYWVSYGITLLTGDPIMTGHWVMLLQVSLALGFLFFAVKRFSSIAPAALSVIWLMHSRNTMQRMTGGLPRGWTPAIFAAFLYFVSSKHSSRGHWGALVTIFLAAMLNPPGALIVGVAYGLILAWRWLSSRTGAERVSATRTILRALAVAPLFVVVALAVVQRPAHIGQMVSFSEASQMPEFARPLGRFPFLPLRPAFEELKIFGFQAFIGRLYRPNPFWRDNIWWLVPTSLLSLAALGLGKKRRTIIPVEIALFGLASLTTYTLSRAIAFKLFVPDRHLQIPMVIFMVSAFTIAIWRLMVRRSSLNAKGADISESSLRRCWPAILAYCALGGVVYACSGNGLQGDANFNYPSNKRGRMYEWVRNNTSDDALIACHPTHCDGMQLFGVRRALVTTETSHPFYPRYNLEMRRRSEVSLRAHYAQSLDELVTLLQPEGVTHFIFRRADFRSDNLPRQSYFPPLDRLVKNLVKRPTSSFVFFELPKELDAARYPYVKFIDDTSIIVDIKALAEFLRVQRGWSPPQASLSASIERHARRVGERFLASNSEVGRLRR